MKAASAALNTHINQSTTSLATCFQVKRTDDTIFRFTTADIPLLVDISDGNGEQTYIASSSYNRSAISNNDTFSVDSLDVTGVLDSSVIDENELRLGLFDFAEVHIFVVNYLDLTQGILRMRRGWFGEVTVTPNGFFIAELRGLTQALSRTVGKLVSAECRLDLGEPNCGAPIAPALAERVTALALGDFRRLATPLAGLVDTTLLVHADTDADDSSPNAATGTLGSQAAVQAVEMKFGAGAIEFTPSGSVNPSNSFVSFPDISAYTIGASPFTIEGFVRFKDLTESIQVFASHYNNTGNERAWQISRQSGDIGFFASDDGTSAAPAVSVLGTFTPGWAINTWYHVAVTRDANDDVRMFVDGVQYGTTTAFTFAVHNSTAPLWLGKFRSTGFDDFPLDGFLDEWRFIIGSALYTANFTPPIAAFPDSTVAAVIAALTCEDYDDRIYTVTVAGTTGAVYPTPDTVVGNTTVDSGVTWTAEEAWTRCIEVTAVDGTDPRKKFTVTELTPNSSGTISGRDFFPDDSLNEGAVAWETGLNSGRAMEARDFVADDGITITQDIELFLDMPFDIAVGDKATIYWGCDKSLADCIVFDRVHDRDAEDYVPGQDLLASYPDAKS